MMPRTSAASECHPLVSKIPKMCSELARSAAVAPTGKV